MSILYSKIHGQGPPFIILHGFLGMGDNWKTLGRDFSDQGFEVHLVDQRNHGKSFHDDDFSYEILVEDLKKNNMKAIDKTKEELASFVSLIKAHIVEVGDISTALDQEIKIHRSVVSAEVEGHSICPFRHLDEVL